MTLSFLKSGKAVHEEVERADLLSAAAYGPQRFWLKEGEEGRITFVDGDLLDGLLNCTASYYEHMIPRAGRKGFDNYPCTSEKEACPIDEGGGANSTPSLVFAFTVIDHRQWTDKASKVHQHERRLFVCKRETFKRLTAKAVKHGGLVGVTFDVTRIGAKSASVGSDFDFVDKNPLSVVANECKLKIEDVLPFDYGEVIKYFDAAELRKMGFGVQGAVVGDNDLADAKGHTTTGSGTFNAAKDL
jgi:hypothetical protein